MNELRIPHDLPSGLVAAQLRVMDRVPYVKKTKTKGLNYSFASEVDLIAALRPAMLAEGLSVYPSQVFGLTETRYFSSNDKPMVNVRATITYTFSHVSSGESVKVVVHAEASDHGDKASSKMMTMALKYTLRQFFMIETGDDPDLTAHERAADNEEAGQRLDRVEERVLTASTDEELDEYLKRIAPLPPALRAEAALKIERRRKELTNDA